MKQFGALCGTTNRRSRCPLWVISDHSDPRPRCRLYPRKRPQKRTSTGAFFRRPVQYRTRLRVASPKFGNNSKGCRRLRAVLHFDFEIGSTEPGKYIQRGSQMRPLYPGIGIGGWRPYWLADDAVWCEPVSTPNSLLTGKNTGKFAKLRLLWRAHRFRSPQFGGPFCNFP